MPGMLSPLAHIFSPTLGGVVPSGTFTKNAVFDGWPSKTKAHCILSYPLLVAKLPSDCAINRVVQQLKSVLFESFLGRLIIGHRATGNTSRLLVILPGKVAISG
jgi:hypothetical protein